MIKILGPIYILILSLKAHSLAPTLRVGDVLLQPLYCWSCALIEAEENSIYSHMGIVVQVSPEILVAESWLEVKVSPLREFMKKTEKGQAIRILRFQNERITKDFEKGQLRLMKIFKEEFVGKKYDEDFRWNNFDAKGDEVFYCSELVSKLIQAFAGIEGPIKRMVFNVNRDHWVRYFQGRPLPIGEWGNSPADYEKSELFYFFGEL